MLYDSPYVTETQNWPYSDEKRRYVRNLMRLKYLMSKTKEGHNSPLIRQSIERLKEQYPLAYEVFSEELEEVS